ncbi:ABC transporter ATP-binding protein [Nocardioides sp. Kera G14]|uniref:ABC transporter ATP-binding protein n=1 Tax=Nocardioides sp. Kera G14 TaxID=2884264 RepID=UPI001D12965C|nr:ABC transporter ATP-binding protein [Nocardioides sp. Kera G14]UDY24738.1 ABC transporter ATP-binding protein [Nocardioides sp. Kera G14]
MTVILSLQHVSRSYRDGDSTVVALDDISLDVAAGELVAIMGPSGAGKSTLLQIAGGLEPFDAGDVRIEGRSLRGATATELARTRRTSVGYVFQELNLIPTLTALENVTLPLELDGVASREADRIGRDALADVGLPDSERRFPDQLSGGQRQRVAIARALAGPRRLLLADEPTGALDSRTGEEVLKVLRERIDAGAAGVLVTHDSRHAAWADRIVFLRDGRIVDSTEGSRV